MKTKRTSIHSALLPLLLLSGLTANAAFATKVPVYVETDQPSSIKTVNGTTKEINLPAIVFFEKDKTYEFKIEGKRGFFYDSESLSFSTPETLKIRLAYEPYVIGKEFCYWTLLLPGICGIGTGEHVLGGSLVLSSLVGIYASAFYVRSLAVSAKAEYDALPAGTSQADFDAKLKSASSRNTNFGILLGIAATWHLLAIILDGAHWGIPTYSTDPRAKNVTSKLETNLIKIGMIPYPGEVVNYAYTSKNF